MSEQKPLKPKWQKRFDFFDKYGVKPSSPEYKAALKNLPFMEQVNIRTNFLGLFFNWIYLFILGVWRKNLVLILLIVIATIVLELSLLQFGLPEETLIRSNRALGIIVMFIYGSWANRIYYLHVVKGSRSWNPFE